MPGNEVEDRICNLFELDNSSQGQHLLHGVDGGWSLLNDSQWVGKQRQSVVPLNFNLQNYSVQQLGINVYYYPQYPHFCRLSLLACGNPFLVLNWAF